VIKGALLGATGLSVASAALTPGIARASQNEIIYIQPDWLTYNWNVEIQEQWTYCGLCRNLYYAPGNALCVYYSDINHPFPSNNPKGFHVAGSTTNYGTIIDRKNLPTTPPQSGGYAYLQNPWRWCYKCSCLFWGPGEGQCAWGGIHDSSRSGVYYMPYGVEPNGAAAWTADVSLQAGWRYCYNCKCQYWGGQWRKTWCMFQVTSGLGPGTNNGNNGYGHAPGDTVYYVAMPS
jgi:hypothetical protein